MTLKKTQRCLEKPPRMTKIQTNLPEDGESATLLFYSTSFFLSVPALALLLTQPLLSFCDPLTGLSATKMLLDHSISIPGTHLTQSSLATPDVP